MKNISIIILAAGKGSRMRSSIAKPLHKIGNRPIIEHALNHINNLTKKTKAKCKIIMVVAPHQKDLMQVAKKHKAKIVIQTEQKGTSHAVLQCSKETANSDALLVLFGDTPFVSAEFMKKLLSKINDKTAIAVAAFETHKANAYGRIILENNKPVKIIEAKDATPQELKIPLCNGGVMAIHKSALKLLKKIDNNNKQKEYLLPHIVGLAKKAGLGTEIVKGEESDFMGVNSPSDLAACEAIFQNKMRQDFLAKGIRMMAPETVYFSADTSIAENVDIEPYVIFGEGVKIKSGCHIYGFSHITGAHIGNDVAIGPYARIRPTTIIGDNSKIGNFVEVKNAKLGVGAKASHLSYVGDSVIGSEVNIGAGVITCNYDGKKKHKTEIESQASIGANVSLVAPIKIGKGARIGAGSVITENVKAGDTALTRAPQTIKAPKRKR